METSCSLEVDLQWWLLLFWKVTMKLISVLSWAITLLCISVEAKLLFKYKMWTFWAYYLSEQHLYLPTNDLILAIEGCLYSTGCIYLSPHQNGTVQCEAISCPPPQCLPGTVPAYVKSACCKECQREWRTLNPVTLLHSSKHGHNCTETVQQNNLHHQI